MNPQKWRIAKQVVWSEDDEISNFLTNAIAAILFRKESLEPFGAYVGLDIPSEDSVAGRIQGSLMQIRCEDLYLWGCISPGGLLKQEHRQGVCFLSGRAADRPDAQDVFEPLSLK